MKQYSPNTFNLWLKKSKNDLKAANKLAQKPEPLYDMAVYHCQQTGEKALKAYLVFNNIEPSKTHDLNFLLSKCIRIDKSFSALYDDCELLTPLATEFRYPDDIFEPSFEEFDEALNSAGKIYNFVADKLLFV